jgi:hypothetical protein
VVSPETTRDTFTPTALKPEQAVSDLGAAVSVASSSGQIQDEDSVEELEDGVEDSDEHVKEIDKYLRELSKEGELTRWHAANRRCLANGPRSHSGRLTGHTKVRRADIVRRS